MNIKIFKLLFFLIIYKATNENVVEDCQIGNYCESEKYGCSVYGNCNFKIFDYFKENSTDEDRLPHCECNMGYSSYDITDLKLDNNILCCYEQKGQLTAFLLEMFIGILGKQQKNVVLHQILKKKIYLFFKKMNK